MFKKLFPVLLLVFTSACAHISPESGHMCKCCQSCECCKSCECCGEESSKDMKSDDCPMCFKKKHMKK